MRVRSLLFTLTLGALFASAAIPLRGQEAPPSALPPGDGRDIVAATCSQCHSLTAITHLREGRNAWRHQIFDMVQRGAQVQPDELDTMLTYLVANFGPGVPFPGATPSQVQLPAGNGSDLVTQKCSLCHGLDRITATTRTRAQWTAIVNRMIYLGAPLTTDETKTIVDYLSTNDAPPGTN